MPLIDFFGGGQQRGDSATGSAFSRLLDRLGNSIGRKQREFFPETQDGLLVMGKNDQYATFLRTDRKGNLLSGVYIPEFIEPFESGTVNPQKWTTANTTFAPAQSTAAGYNMNSTNLTTASAVAILQSNRYFYKYPRVPLQLKSRVRHALVANSLMDFGFGLPSGTTTLVPNGCGFRMTGSNQIQGYLSYNSAETVLSVLAKTTDGGNVLDTPLNMSALTSNYYVYDIIIDDDNVVFTIQDSENGAMIGMLNLPVPRQIYKAWGATLLPCYYRLWNSVSTPTTAPVGIISEMQALSLDWNIGGGASQAAGNVHMSAGRHPWTGAQMENHVNNIAPTSATLSNTAAGYATLGGKFQFAAIAGAATDYVLFGQQLVGKFLCEGIIIDTYNTGAAVATTGTVLEWALGFNSSAASLATANIIRRQVGVQAFAVGDPIGKVAQRIDMNFTTPEIVEHNRFLQVILNMPIATANASQIIRGTVTIKGRYI